MAFPAVCLGMFADSSCAANVSCYNCGPQPSPKPLRHSRQRSSLLCGRNGFIAASHKLVCLSRSRTCRLERSCPGPGERTSERPIWSRQASNPGRLTGSGLSRRYAAQRPQGKAHGSSFERLQHRPEKNKLLKRFEAGPEFAASSVDGHGSKRGPWQGTHSEVSAINVASENAVFSGNQRMPRDCERPRQHFWTGSQFISFVSQLNASFGLK